MLYDFIYIYIQHNWNRKIGTLTLNIQRHEGYFFENICVSFVPGNCNSVSNFLIEDDS